MKQKVLHKLLEEKFKTYDNFMLLSSYCFQFVDLSNGLPPIHVVIKNGEIIYQGLEMVSCYEWNIIDKTVLIGH